MSTLDTTIARIESPDVMSAFAARERHSHLTKPKGSLGDIEELSISIAGIQGRPDPRVDPGAIFVMAGDHGVCAEGVSAFPSEVTAQMVLNFVRGGAAINVLGARAGARVVVTDVGVAYDFDPGLPIHHKKIARGTGNIAEQPAMTMAEARRCVEAGIEVFEEEFARAPFGIAATGDMGIGNTTPSTAMAAVFTGHAVTELAGRGTGIDYVAFKRKISVIEKAISRHAPDPENPLEVLATLGGLEIGALAGVMLASAAHKIPVVVDGYISGAAALLARALAPLSVEYMIASHLSGDSGHGLMLEHLGLKPLLRLGMRLGEGTGAALAMTLCSAACAVLNEMATFESAGVRRE